jgi:hypothetical protein
MKLNLKNVFAALLGFQKPAEEDAGLPVSLVLLLRDSHFLTLDQLRLAGERAFGTSFAGTRKEARHFVVELTLFTIMKAGPHTLSFLNYTKPYGEGDFPQEFGRSLPEASQRLAWAAHKAWTAVDYVKGGVDVELEHCVLAKLCAEMLDNNCVGVYVPREHSFIPNDGALRMGLLRIAASRYFDTT